MSWVDGVITPEEQRAEAEARRLTQAEAARRADAEYGALLDDAAARLALLPDALRKAGVPPRQLWSGGLLGTDVSGWRVDNLSTVGSPGKWEDDVLYISASGQFRIARIRQTAVGDRDSRRVKVKVLDPGGAVAPRDAAGHLFGRSASSNPHLVRSADGAPAKRFDHLEGLPYIEPVDAWLLRHVSGEQRRLGR